MRMLTTYLTPTSGRAAISGHDVLDEPLAVRKKVGYLPENVPLYPEMRVREYLTLSGQAQGRPPVEAAVGDRPRRSARCGLLRRRAAARSASSRRATASGSAWPSRWSTTPTCSSSTSRPPGSTRSRSARSATLIRELGERHTILLSTHIMSEVEAVCGRVILIAKGPDRDRRPARPPPGRDARSSIQVRGPEPADPQGDRGGRRGSSG